MARTANPEGIESETLTADEQAAMDADRAAEVAENQEQQPSAADDAGDQAAAADGAADEPAATDGQPPRQGMVPHAALHEAREKEKAAAARAAEAERKAQVLEERTNLLLQRFAAPQQPAPATPTAPAIPPFEEDPAGHILGQVRQQGAILGELVQAVTGQSRQSEAQAALQKLIAHASATEREFAAANPDYDKASTHLFETRRKMLQAGGRLDAAAINNKLAEEAVDLAREAVMLGRTPAEYVYELAKSVGYVTPAPEAAANGSADPAAAEAQLRTIAAGQQQSRSVGNLRGSGPAPLTATRLSEMSNEEFLEVQKMKPEEFRNLMGA
jgi:hypothetical protein